MPAPRTSPITKTVSMVRLMAGRSAVLPAAGAAGVPAPAPGMAAVLMLLPYPG